MTDNNQPPPEQSVDQTPATGTGAGQQPGKPADKTFTEEDLNRIIRDRIKETKASVQADLLKDLGVTNLDEAKLATAKLKEIQDAQLSAQQKLERDLAERDKALVETRTKYQATLIENAALKELNGQVPPERYKAAIKLLDQTKLVIDDSGKVAGVVDAVKALLEENPFLKGDPQAPVKPGGTKINPTNPAGGAQGYDLSWFKPAQQNKNSFGGGGVRPPPGEDK